MLPKLSPSSVPCRLPESQGEHQEATPQKQQQAPLTVNCQNNSFFKTHIFFSCLVLGLHSYLEENHFRSQNTEPGPHKSFNPAFCEELVQSHSSWPPPRGKTTPPSHVAQRRSQRKRPRGLPSFRKSLCTYIPTGPALLMSPLKCKQILSTVRLLLMLFHPL